MTLQIRYVADGRIVSCPSLVTAKDLLTLIARESVTLARMQPLRQGVHRTYRLILPNSELLDLEGYGEAYNTSRELIALIEPSDSRLSVPSRV